MVVLEQGSDVDFVQTTKAPDSERMEKSVIEGEEDPSQDDYLIVYSDDEGEDLGAKEF